MNPINWIRRYVSALGWYGCFILTCMIIAIVVGLLYKALTVAVMLKLLGK